MTTDSQTAKRADLSWPADKTALLLDITCRRLQQLVKAGVILKLPSGRFDPFDCAKAYIRYLRELAHRPDMSRTEYEEVRRRKMHAEAQLREIQLAEKNKELVPMASSVHAITTIAHINWSFIRSSGLPVETQDDIAAQLSKFMTSEKVREKCTQWEKYNAT